MESEEACPELPFAFSPLIRLSSVAAAVIEAERVIITEVLTFPL